MIIESFVVGIAASVCASAVFLIAMYRLRPHVEISPVIADLSDGNGPRFAFKIINRTKARIFDVSAQTLLISPVQVAGGPVNNVREIQLLKSDFFEVGAFNQNDADAHYALRFGTSEDLRRIWTHDSQFLRVNVIAKHGLSGFANIATMTFNTKGSIKKGKHRFGNSLAVEDVT